MKVSINLANKFSNVNIAKNGIEEVIARVGAQLGAIEDVEYWGKKFEMATIVKVVTCEKHPNADKLSVCMVDDGGVITDVERNAKGYVQVVCGAPNVKAGVFAVWLPPTSTVPTTYANSEPFVLSARDLRGVTSNGMMAAPDELGLEGGHEGLLLLEDAKPGDNFADVYGINDVVLDLENKMFTHRPDCFGVLGVARELAGIQNMQFNSPNWYLEAPDFENLDAETLPINVEVKTDLVPRLMAVAMQNVTIAESPQEIKAALVLSGIRPINNVVDITNYLMQITGQPLHAYDYDKLVLHSKAATPSVIARKSVKGENLLLLNGKTLEAQDDESVMIATDNMAIGVGGAMGGADTEVDENTKNIVLECANFDMYNLRRTSMKYGLFTDAVTRFNKGQSPLQNDRVLAEAMRMVATLAGGKQASDVKDIKAASVKNLPAIDVNAEFINVRLGSKLGASEIAALLNNVELKTTAIGDDIHVEVPFWRRDLEIADDIVEEVGRLYGFNKLPVELPKRTSNASRTDPLIEFKNHLRNTLAAAGANEISSYSFVHGKLLEKVGQNAHEAFKLSNAISPNLQYYRLSLTPSLLERTTPNIRTGYEEFAIFEIGKSHTKKWLDKDGLPLEAERLALVFAADKKAAKKFDYAPYYKVRAFADELFNKLGVNVKYNFFAESSSKIVESQPVKPFLPARSAIITATDGEFIGVIGEFTKPVIDNLKLPEFCAGFELDVKQLMRAAKVGKKYLPLPKYPKVEQDISLKVAKTVAYGDLYGLLTALLNKNKPKNTWVKFEPIDIYKHGDNKHFAFRLTIASYDETLKTETVNELLDTISRQANKTIACERL